MSIWLYLASSGFDKILSVSYINEGMKLFALFRAEPCISKPWTWFLKSGFFVGFINKLSTTWWLRDYTSDSILSVGSIVVCLFGLNLIKYGFSFILKQKMFSQFFVLSLRGDTILHKDCKQPALTTVVSSQKRPRNCELVSLRLYLADVPNTRGHPKLIRWGQRTSIWTLLCTCSLN